MFTVAAKLSKGDSSGPVFYEETFSDAIDY